MSSAALHLQQLAAIFTREMPLAIAVSGGVDSMILAFAAHSFAPEQVRMFHAVSPAVPPSATRRVRAFAKQERWNLTVIDAGEFADPAYRDNPPDRCYFCKRGLFGSIISALQASTLHRIAAGTNLDDVGDFRPGLQAAKEHKVCHPFVEAGMHKSDVRALAAHFDLAELAELPASPCLSSRVETGLPIVPAQLQKVDRVEQQLRLDLAEIGLTPTHVRCRVRKSTIEIALDEVTLGAVHKSGQSKRLIQRAQTIWGATQAPLTFATYAMGQSFVAGHDVREQYAQTPGKLLESTPISL